MTNVFVVVFSPFPTSRNTRLEQVLVQRMISDDTSSEIIGCWGFFGNEKMQQ
jgi:hypothetical protein